MGIRSKPVDPAIRLYQIVVTVLAVISTYVAAISYIAHTTLSVLKRNKFHVERRTTMTTTLLCRPLML
jgi:hypothetical protein